MRSPTAARILNVGSESTMDLKSSTAPKTPRKVMVDEYENMFAEDMSVSTSFSSFSSKRGPRVLKLMQKKRWRALGFYLKAASKKAISKLCEETSLNVLHEACGLTPPSNIIRKLIELFPRTLEQIDCNGRTPLHVAVASGASFSVIESLVNSYPEAVSLKDYRGKTPLHLACTRSMEAVDVESGRPDASALCIISLLCTVAPTYMFLDDRNNQTILEYAILRLADSDTIQVLQDATTEAIREVSAQDKTASRRKS